MLALLIGGTEPRHIVPYPWDYNCAVHPESLFFTLLHSFSCIKNLDPLRNHQNDSKDLCS